MADQPTTAALKAGTSPSNELTFTVVVLGTESRIGIDRDEDGTLDRDEIDAGSDPDDAASTPGTTAWTNLGQGLAGTYGQPLLQGRGTMVPGETVELILTGARENSSSALVVGFSELNGPFFGGHLGSPARRVPPRASHGRVR